MKKSILLIVAVTAFAGLACTVPTKAQTSAMSPPVGTGHGSRTIITEAQFEASIGSVPFVLNGQTLANTQMISLAGLTLTERTTFGSGTITITTAQAAAFLATLPTLPSGETASTLVVAMANRDANTPTIYLFAKFSQ